MVLFSLDLGPLHLELHLSPIPRWDVVAAAASGLVALCASHLDGWAFRGRRASVDEALVPGGQVAAYVADGVKLIDLLGDGEQLRDWPKRFAPEIHVRTRHDDPDSTIRQGIDNLHDAYVQELGLVDRYDFHVLPHGFGDLNGGGDRDGFGFMSVVGVDGEHAAVSVI